MFLLYISHLLKLWSDWTRRVGNRDNLPPWCCTALGPLSSCTFPCDRFAWTKWKPVEVSSAISFVLRTVYRFPRLQVDSSRQLVWYLLPSQVPPGKYSGVQQAGMPFHGTDTYTWAERASSAGGEEMTHGFSSPRQHRPCLETWHSLRLFQIFNFKLFHLSEELASASRLCLQPRYPALALSPV